METSGGARNGGAPCRDDARMFECVRVAPSRLFGCGNEPELNMGFCRSLI